MRGELSQGATISPMLFPYHNGGSYEQNEIAFQNAENWIEKYSILGIFGHYIGNLFDNAAKSLEADATNAGNKIYSINIPFVSNVGAAMLGSGKGLVDMASDPIQTADR